MKNAGPLAKEVEETQESSLFSTLFDLITSGNYFHRNVCVEIRKSETGPWISVHEGLKGKLLLMKTLGFMYLKYILLSHDVAAPLSPPIQLPNALTRLMGSRHQFPAQKREDTRNILLYNHIIQLFQSRCVGWLGDGHITYGKRFIERLTKAIWYIDPHLEKLRSRGSNSIELSLAEPWASKNSWQEVVLNVFKFTSMMKKYLDHLETTNNNMRTLHESENPAREPSNNCNIHLISKCNEEIDSRYCILDFDLANREVFDFVDLNLYISDDPIKKHNFIHDIQLSTGRNSPNRLEIGCPILG
ncbi:uncharacterized protein OCT59_028568 [Rhizophagus irregularis]|uniref:uncharacterized protein n=1 Tax=Rhizophagus irregularis TaxID=588596 RepID=UPI00331AAE63|nr:hypothetical protein OCT59_028568 [Rhizophagus irregularis]